MQFILMDLIGEFHPPSQQGHRYALTVIFMHTSYVFCIPLKTKAAQKVIQAYIRHVYSMFGGSEKILSDNGTEFKNELFEEVSIQLGVEYKVYTPLYRIQCNGKIEGFHKYLKSCIAKHIANNMDWDEFTDLATAAYNFIPNVTSKEAPIFLIFGRDPYMPLNQLISTARRYLGTNESIPDLEALQNLLQLTTMQIEYAAKRKNQNFKPVKPHDFKVGDLVVVRKSHLKSLPGKIPGSFLCDKVPRKKNQLEVKDQIGHVRQVHITDVKKTIMPEVIAKAIPNYIQFGRTTKLRLNPNYVEDLEWTIPEEFPLLPKEPAPEVSVIQVQAPPPRILSQTTLTTESMSYKTKKQDTSWFWSITEKFKEGLHHQVSSDDLESLPICSDKPL